MATSFPASLDTLTNPSSGDSLNSPSHSGQHADANDAIEALQAKVGVDSSAVTTSLDYKLRFQSAPEITSGVLVSPEERWSISATAATGTVNVDTVTSTAVYYTSNASANWTFNFRGDGSTSLDSVLTTGDSITVAFAVTNGATAYYPTVFQVDGSAVTPKWQGGEAPAEGNASSVDVYVFTVLKTASATFTVFASQTQFA
jgi:hypothetical protein